MDQLDVVFGDGLGAEAVGVQEGYRRLGLGGHDAGRPELGAAGRGHAQLEDHPLGL